ncbi:unnamed protein product [Lasius platythorax]|uniref:Uncharacterized protein n=1 Tax=Lasius platythorax TaxID=488582 RepID=A0AAV2N9J0_9HYME
MSESIVFLFHRSTLYLCNDVNITRHPLPSSDRLKILLSTINIQCQCIRLQKRKAHKIALCRNPFLDISSFLATARCHPAADMRNLSPGYQRCGLPRTYSLVYKIAVRSSRGYDRPSLWRYPAYTGCNASCRMSPSHKRHAHIRNRLGSGATILSRTRINSRFGFALYCKPTVYSPRDRTHLGLESYCGKSS